MASPALKLVAAARELSQKLAPLRFAEPVTHVYNPLEYAAAAHEAYLKKYVRAGQKVVFLGMNPGPYGMTQTGVPFGEITAVRDWLGITAPIGKPPSENPKRLVTGFACPNSEVSGRRLWGLFASRFGTADAFFDHHFVANFCPLVFMEAGGKNRTPDKLPVHEMAAVYAACDDHLRKVVAALEPEWLIGVGGFAEGRAKLLQEDFPRLKIARILHPSPASPAANRDWAGNVTRTMTGLGIWEA
jgi:single-strand selective monofunctional uracil DNA glycosylase